MNALQQIAIFAEPLYQTKRLQQTVNQWLATCPGRVTSIVPTTTSAGGSDVDDTLILTIVWEPSAGEEGPER